MTRGEKTDVAGVEDEGRTDEVRGDCKTQRSASVKKQVAAARARCCRMRRRKKRVSMPLNLL